ncbi:MAG: tetratricopeptide repeat protein [Desulfovibrionaceae bacterium]
MSENTDKTQGQSLGIDQEVSREASPLYAFIDKHKTILLGVIVGILAAATVYGGVKWWNQHSHNSARTELGGILTETSGDQRVEALRIFADKAPASVKDGALFELAGALMQLGRFDESIAVWDELLSGLSTVQLKTVAGLGKARCLLLGDKPTEALAVIREIKGSAPAEFVTPVNRLLAVAAEQAGEKDVALTAYQELLSGGQIADAEFIQYKIGRLQAGQ